MESQPSQQADPHLVAAILQSDSLIRELQRELRLVSPNLLIPSETLRTVLRDQIIRAEILQDERATAAQGIVSRAAEKRKTRTTGTFAVVAPDDPNEHVGDTLWHDKTQASGGG